ncbi:beta-glucuronosyltransferase GlcAT14A-like [Rutidosis leptorrhynchoides]|uniref:beta-glucuronosyltransferase GlcAT14A-like n=1 Tax=Rutidosis leptorrhynchoides TaxID=125765 RepID=UPI003A98EB14
MVAFVRTGLESSLPSSSKRPGKMARDLALDSLFYPRCQFWVKISRNIYILHMDLEAPLRERLELTMAVKNAPTFNEVENVRLMAQSNLVTNKGPTMIATTLQAIAILLKDSLNWDWFINLGASNYPLVTQDDLLHVFSNLSRTLNFVEHIKLTGWKLNQRAKPIIVDPGLYFSKKSDLAITSQRTHCHKPRSSLHRMGVGTILRNSTRVT